MAGIDLPVKLRRGLGQGKVVPAAELAKWLAPHDADKDGEVTRPELVVFLSRNRVGGPWFCEVVAKTLWGFVQQKLGREVASIRIDLVARILHTVMGRGPRPERRYEISPEAMVGYKPLELIKQPGDPPSSGASDSFARPRATPRGGVTTPQRSQSTTPGRPAGAGPAGGGVARPALPRRPAPRRPGPRR